MRLLPGDLLLVDSRCCHEFHFGERCDTLSIELPLAWVERWLPAPPRRTRRCAGRAELPEARGHGPGRQRPCASTQAA